MNRRPAECTSDVMAFRHALQRSARRTRAPLAERQATAAAFERRVRALLRQGVAFNDAVRHAVRDEAAMPSGYPDVATSGQD
jgi:hypothetical protein